MDFGRQLADLMQGSEPAETPAPAKRIAKVIDPERLRRLTGLAEAAATFGTGLAASVPAGMAGMAQMIPTRGRTPDINKAAQTVEDVQGALTYLPRTPTGQRVLERGIGAMEMLGAPAEYIGEKTLQYTGSPGAATAANVLLDPVNFIGMPGSGKATVAATKAAGRAAVAAPRVAGEMLQDLMMGQGRMEGQRGAIKMKGGNWLAGEVEGATEPLRQMGASGSSPEEMLAQMRERYTPEATAALEPPLQENVARSFKTLEGMSALNNWIDKKLNRYIRNEMATPEDPVRKLADQGITHVEINPEGVPFANAAAVREEAGFPRQGYATTQAGKNWEATADFSILNTKAGEMGDPTLWGSPKAFESYMALNPWVAKAAKEAPETRIYEMSGRTGGLGFDHLIDELKNAIRPDSDLPANLRWKPEDLEKVTMEQAVRRVHDINQYRAAKKAEANEALARNPATVTFKEYPTVPGTDKPNEKGLAWKEIKPVAMPEDFVVPERYSIVSPTPSAETLAIRDNQTGKYITTGLKSEEQARKHLFETINKQQLQDALKYEGDVMGHCVGGYCDDVLSGNTKIYTLRDKKGEPHVTIEVERPSISPVEWLHDQPRDIADQIRAQVGDRPTMSQMSSVVMTHPKYQQDLAALPQNIVQIKGKANRAPKEEYLPFVQDFVRGGNWSRVGDIQNTGMTYLHPENEVAKGLAEKGLPVPKYVTDDEYKQLRKQAFEGKPGLIIPENVRIQRKAKGGTVHISDNPDTMALELAGGGFVAAGKAAKAAAKAAAKQAEKPAFTAKQLQSTAEKMAGQLKAENPKLTDDEAMKKGLRLAEQKLKWEKVEKPELEKSYGALEKSKFSDPLARRQRNVPEVVEKRIKETQEFLKQPTEPWTPPRKELQAFERERIKEALEGFPGIEQTKFPRYEPARADLGYIDEIYDDPVNRELIKGQIARGLPLGGETFYASLYPLKLAALERGIPEAKFNEFIYSIAPASARNSIMNEMAVGQFMRDMRARGLSLDEDTVKQEMAAFKEKYGTGLPLMPVHREGVRNVLEGSQDLREMLKADIPTNYKIPTYGTQKAGDFAKSMVLDVHESAGQTRGSRYHPYFTEQGGFGPTEYGAAENKMLGIAGEMGIPGGMAQAGRWFGGGELTGLKSPRGDALDLLEKQTAYTLQGMGINPTPRNIRNYVLDMIEKGEGVLMPWFKKEGMPDVRTEKKKGGAVKKAAGGAIKAAAKAAERAAKAAKPDVLPAAEREANLARMLEASQVKSPLYHSSRSPDIDTFYSWSHLGTKKAAEDRARQIMQTNPEGVTTYPVHALVKNPLRTEDLGLNQMGFWNLEKLIDSLDSRKVDFSKWSGGKKGLKADYATDQDPSIVEDFLRRNGYDSIVYRNQAEDPGSDSYIIFNPKNIKSATGNRGTFDVTRPEITKKRGGKVSITDNLDTMRLAVQKRK